MRKGNVVFYTQKGCESCVKLKKLLDATSLEYKEIEVLAHQPLWESIRSGEVGIMYTPTLALEVPKEKKIIYISAGRDFDTEEEGLEKFKNLL